MRWGCGLGRSLLSLAAPEFCRECLEPLQDAESPFCERCAAGIVWIDGCCARCGYPVTQPAGLLDGGPPADAADGGTAGGANGDADAPAPPHPIDRLLTSLPGPCGVCRPLTPAFEVAAAGGAYSGALRTAVLRFKFQGDAAVAPLLDGALARAMRAPALAAVLALGPALVPVPLHWGKRWWRGRDPVLELAQRSLRPGGPAHGLEILPLLEKTRWTPPQMRLSRSSRRKNLRGAFRCRSGGPGDRRGCPAAILLIDDVLTTGATASACAAALKRAGARLVAVVAAARSP